MSHGSLIVQLEDSFLMQYPHASIHALTAEGVHQLDRNVVERWKQRAQQEVNSWQVDPQRLVEQPWIAEWRSVIKKMGLNAAKKRSSIEQLAKRALAGDLISISVTAVNLYCYISLIAQTPMGGYACDSLNGTVRIRLSRSADTFLAIGERQAISVPPKTVVYADDRTVACFAWNHRDSAFTCLKPTTEHAVFFADASLVESHHRAERAITLLAEALEEAGAMVVSRGFVDGSAKELQLATKSVASPKC
jgi:DNA/RNA-binding domain of Phe-tRNA-synthetase-like protein